MKKIVFIILIIMNMVCAKAIADDLEFKLSTDNGNTVFNIIDSNDVIRSTVSSNGVFYVSTGVFKVIKNGSLEIKEGKLLGALTTVSNIGDFYNVYISSLAGKPVLYPQNNIDFGNNNIVNINNVIVTSVTASDINGLNLLNQSGDGLYISNGGNIGVGVSDPAQRLEVNGDINVDYGVISSTGDLFELYVGTITLNTLKISGAGLIGGLTLTSSIGDFGNAYVSNITAKTDNKLYVNSNLDLLNNDINNANKVYTTSLTAVDINGLYINESGFIGIETAPEYKLDVSGDINSPYGVIGATGIFNKLISPSLTDSVLTLSDGKLTNGASLSFEYGDVSEVFVSSVRARNSLGLNVVNNSNNLIFVKNGGNVGVKTIDPAQKLEVGGDINVDYGITAGTGSINNISVGNTLTDSVLTINNNKVLGALNLESTVGDFNDVYVSTIIGQPILYLYNDLYMSNNDIQNIDLINGSKILSTKLGDDSGLGITFSGTKVGINETNPTSKLHVNGSMNVTYGVSAVTGSFTSNYLETDGGLRFEDTIKRDQLVMWGDITGDEPYYDYYGIGTNDASTMLYNVTNNARHLFSAYRNSNQKRDLVEINGNGDTVSFYGWTKLGTDTLTGEWGEPYIRMAKFTGNLNQLGGSGSSRYLVVPTSIFPTNPGQFRIISVNIKLRISYSDGVSVFPGREKYLSYKYYYYIWTHPTSAPRIYLSDLGGHYTDNPSDTPVEITIFYKKNY